MKCTTDFVFGNSKMGTYILWSEPVYRCVMRSVCVCEPMCVSVQADMREKRQEYEEIERISPILTPFHYNFGRFSYFWRIFDPKNIRIGSFQPTPSMQLVETHALNENNDVPSKYPM